MPDEAEVLGLLALMLLLDARHDARFHDGELVLLADQDRSLYERDEIAGGRRLLDRAIALNAHGPFVVQAAIASLHAVDQPDWPQIAALYGELSRLTGSPVVELNRAVAVAETDGPGRRWRSSSDSISATTATCTRHRADLLRRLGRVDEARLSYRHALALTHDDAERRCSSVAWPSSATIRTKFARTVRA